MFVVVRSFLSEGYFLRLQEHIETTLTKQKITGELALIIPLKRETAWA